MISIHHAIRMGTLIIVGSIYAGTNQSMADVISAFQRCIRVGGIMWVDVNCIIKLLLPGKFDQFCS